jgi:WD40 repeat protein
VLLFFIRRHTRTLTHTHLYALTGKREPQDYLCHCWIDDRLLIGTDTGDILLFENAEFRGVLETSPSDGKSIDSIVAYSKGFVCGCDEGALYVFQKDEKDVYKQTRSFQIDGNYVRILNLAISPSEDVVACTLENNQAFVLGLGNSDILKVEDMNFDPLVLPFHGGDRPGHMQITGLDVCVRKPFVVTTGADRSVRVWNYQVGSIALHLFYILYFLSMSYRIVRKLIIHPIHSFHVHTGRARWSAFASINRSLPSPCYQTLNSLFLASFFTTQARTLECMRVFNEQPHSVAFHPSGLHILVGFTDSLQLVNLLMDELRP